MKLVAVIPAIVTDETTYAVASTPPYEAVIPGQRMIIPVEEETIPSFGGVN